MDTEALTALLTSMGSIFTHLTGNVGKIFEIMNQYPIAYLGIGSGLVFTSISIVRRIMGR